MSAVDRLAASPQSADALAAALTDDKRFLRELKGFCESEHNTENLLFWMELNKLAGTSSRSSLSVVKHIWNTFLRPTAEHEFNMEEAKRDEIRDLVRDGKGPEAKALLLPLREVAVKQMLTDSIPRFLRTDAWRAMVGGDADAAAAAAGGGGAAGGDVTHAELRAAADAISSKYKLLGMFSMRRKVQQDDLMVVSRVSTAIRAAEVKSGYIFKSGSHHKSWKQRWFVLTGPLAGSPGVLAYYEAHDSPIPKGVVLSEDMTEVVTDASEAARGRSYAFSMSFQAPGKAARSLVMQGSSDRDTGRWVYALQMAQQGEAGALGTTPPPPIKAPSPPARPGSAGAGSPTAKSPGPPPRAGVRGAPEPPER